MSKILCIHPYDKTTRFLDSIQRSLSRELPNQVHHFRVQPWEKSHQDCINRLQATNDELIIFLGHGRSDSFFGAFSDDIRGNVIKGRDKYAENYENESFITEANIKILEEKKVFCLSCNSADKLGRIAVENGTKTFLGFGDIPTENDIEIKYGWELKYFGANYKVELVRIVKLSLVHAIQNNYSFDELSLTIKMITYTRIKKILSKKKGMKHRRLLVKHLFEFSKQMKLFGDGNEKILT